ncbi:MAG: tRNA (guanosine(37)-N1)-methyltransferase TrmD [gamma proteobacterium symbiont of Bathyaustriella thionipta]|nr:tRNA (guanosine(37)-N1)-methyltransferase TrmD [gamma proteobacterium symbiont of Bathyaustriella thionipta]MCU7950328.1 tRNA (guanosine(37)-N1)-methyltransferase TrmD [gamma proteobacterium symbiont of Bathyaustriella thionipta]MCU7952010.1 tRNA (guanosine(37)-N1)-methyltransferase TrmD [gamma proteobacterium symbiont of Bathyaustriella thionipta]MCU7956862.1 tRNA (guanosine(37)-N1)-methyltransferase TrmD [gamma proteobacterium symbiont of Bathyaustriella thionipta]MCU7967473.1 tRNA (guanos
MLKRIDVISLFPEMFDAIQYGITGRAIRTGLIDLAITNPRDFTQDKHKTVDDRPYGGGPGMLMKVQPLKDAILSIKNSKQSAIKNKVVYLSPQGQPLTQTIVKELSENEQLILLAGRYEGVDERLIERYVDYECSIGDYVLSGGELPAMVLIDSLIRLIPGALGHNESAVHDSFYSGLLDHPHYTRPETLVIEGEGECVPEVLLSGNHKNIEQWRLKQSLGRTWQRRPDLLDQRQLNEQEQQLLQEFIQEQTL